MKFTNCNICYKMYKNRIIVINVINGNNLYKTYESSRSTGSGEGQKSKSWLPSRVKARDMATNCGEGAGMGNEYRADHARIVIGMKIEIS